jgi:hypothetical protein
VHITDKVPDGLSACVCVCVCVCVRVCSCVFVCSQEQHLDLLAECSTSALASTTELGQTLDGRSVDMVTIGDGPLNVWAIARQVIAVDMWKDG